MEFFAQDWKLFVETQRTVEECNSSEKKVVLLTSRHVECIIDKLQEFLAENPTFFYPNPKWFFIYNFFNKISSIISL